MSNYFLSIKLFIGQRFCHSINNAQIYCGIIIMEAPERLGKFVENIRKL